MANYQFLKNGEPVNLDVVDKVACELLGIPVDNKNFCYLYEVAINCGFAVLLSQGGFEITKEMFDTWIEPKKDIDEEMRVMLRKLLVEDFQFSGWR